MIMENTTKGMLMGRRTVAYAVTFAVYYLMGTMDHMRVPVQFGLFFCGLIAATILSFMIFLVIATIFPPKAGRWVELLVIATEVAASVGVLELLFQIAPSTP